MKGEFYLLKFPIVLVTLGVLTFGFACAGMAKHVLMPDEIDSVIVMQTDSQQTCCNTSISNHIESWRNILLSVPREIRDRVLLLALGLTIFVMSGLRFQLNFSDGRLFSYKLYARDNPNLLVFNHLKLAFARGILNPKIYQPR